MGLRRSAGAILLALLIASGITAAFVAAGPHAASEPVTYSATRVPAPTAENVTQTGSPPDAVAPFPRFVDVTAASGFDYVPALPSAIEDVNSGVYVVDFDGDGYEDVLAVGDTYPVLFRNTGDGFVAHRTFELPRVQTAHFFDYGDDGDRDLLLAQYAGGLHLYENRDGTFERADAAEPAVLLYRFSSSWAYRLMGASWLVPTAATEDPPSLFGRPLSGPRSGDAPGPLGEPHYGLTARLYTPNPAGFFARYNPTIEC